MFGQQCTIHPLLSTSFSKYMLTKVGRAPAAFNFTADTGWDTDN